MYVFQKPISICNLDNLDKQKLASNAIDVLNFKFPVEVLDIFKKFLLCNVTAFYTLAK